MEWALRFRAHTLPESAIMPTIERSIGGLMKIARSYFIGARQKRAILRHVSPWFLSMVLAPQAWGAFIGDYAPGRLTLTNTIADGFVTTATGGSVLFLTGGNNGSGVAGTTDITVEAAAAGLVRFHFLYSS